jgi:UDP-2,3-diacylglucosamine hydrolase
LIGVKAKAYFLSDIHLESEEDSNFFALKDLLTQIHSDQKCTHLFLLGDIFDLWVSEHEHFRQKFPQTLSLIEWILHRGIEVHYLEGNHDLDLKPYFQTRGVKVHESHLKIQLGFKVFRIEHGDQMDPTDRGYLFLRWFLRTQIMRFIGRKLPGFLVKKIGESMSSTSRKYTDRLKAGLGQDLESRKEKIYEKIRLHVERVLDQGDHFDLFVSGHVHEEFNELMPYTRGSVQVINLGSWLGPSKPYGVFVEGQGFEIEHLGE